MNNDLTLCFPLRQEKEISTRHNSEEAAVCVGNLNLPDGNEV
jgi:hypothetical protein